MKLNSRLRWGEVDYFGESVGLVSARLRRNCASDCCVWMEEFYQSQISGRSCIALSFNPVTGSVVDATFFRTGAHWIALRNNCVFLTCHCSAGSWQVKVRTSRKGEVRVRGKEIISLNLSSEVEIVINWLLGLCGADELDGWRRLGERLKLLVAPPQVISLYLSNNCQWMGGRDSKCCFIA